MSPPKKDGAADPMQQRLESAERREALRMLEAILFASAEPLDLDQLAARMPAGHAVAELVETLAEDYRLRGVNLVRVAGKWMFRTAEDLGFLLTREQEEPRKLPRAALETLAVIAYHQPVTRAEIEQVRGVSLSKGTLDVLLEAGWIRLRGRRRSPGRPVTFGTTDAFLSQFSLDAVQDLPGLEELKAAGLIEGQIPPGLAPPSPIDSALLTADEDPLDEDALDDAFEAEESAEDDAPDEERD